MQEKLIEILQGRWSVAQLRTAFDSQALKEVFEKHLEKGSIQLIDSATEDETTKTINKFDDLFVDIQQDAFLEIKQVIGSLF